MMSVKCLITIKMKIDNISKTDPTDLNAPAFTVTNVMVEITVELIWKIVKHYCIEQKLIAYYFHPGILSSNYIKFRLNEEFSNKIEIFLVLNWRALDYRDDFGRLTKNYLLFISYHYSLEFCYLSLPYLLFRILFYYLFY